jgi:cell division protein FtsQ
MLLTARLIYVFLADAQRFPINTVKVIANYQHISRQDLESVLRNYLNHSFFAIPIRHLQMDLRGLDWTEQVYISRTWPDTLKISLVEKTPVALWNDALMTAEGDLFNVGKNNTDMNLPHLQGPVDQQRDVLQIYQKLSKLLSAYGLHTASLRLRDNQAWDLSLSNGVLLHLGKRDIEKRLLRFCRAYAVAFADQAEQLKQVDLRYARGMAVQWKQAMRK